MFNLKEAITNWRREMSAGGIKTPGVLDELESHLREDIEQRVRAGAAEPQAFEEAVRQMGKADQLKLEFGKVEQLRPQVSPRLVTNGCILLSVFGMATGLWLLFESEISTAQRVLGILWLALICGYGIMIPYLNRRVLFGIRGWSRRRIIAPILSYFSVAWIVVLLLDCTNVIHFSLGTLLLPNLLLWPMFGAMWATVMVMSYTTDPEALGFWSPATQQCIELADQEAIRFHHDFVGTEHVLLGLLEPEDSAVSKVLRNMGVSCEAVRAEIEKIVVPGPRLQTGRALVGTPRAKKAFVLALKEAKSLRCERMDPPHLLLGLLREGSGVAALVLKNLGVNPENARTEILRMRH